MLKEIKMRPKIGDHDLDVKIKHIQRFLEEKNKVKLTMQFFGRERQHLAVGGEKINRVLEAIREYGVPEAPLRRLGNTMNIILMPKK